MSGAIPPLPHYAFMAWCSVKAQEYMKYLVGKPEGKRSLGKPRRRLEDNIRMDVGKTGWEYVNWIHLA
jgi:hypothetical protein